MFVLLERLDGSPIVIAGPCWPFCCFVTVPLIVCISGAVAYFVIISPNSPLVRLLSLAGGRKDCGLPCTEQFPPFGPVRLT